ncbi:hypothetical protein D6810_02090, partial [Candidatus Dojkabacteria bacterium]
YVSSTYLIFLFSLSLGVSLLFFSLHAVIDKYLFKKFFEQPNFIMALRRSLFLLTVILLYFANRVYPIQTQVNLSLLAVVFLLEIFFILGSRQKINLYKGFSDNETGEEINRVRVE